MGSVSGEGQTMVSQAKGPASARWRAPPTTNGACAGASRAAGESASTPSSPKPISVSQVSLRGAVITQRAGMEAVDARIGAWRDDRGERARASPEQGARYLRDTVLC